MTDMRMWVTRGQRVAVALAAVCLSGRALGMRQLLTSGSPP
jgi:hypothetical protein